MDSSSKQGDINKLPLPFPGTGESWRRRIYCWRRLRLKPLLLGVLPSNLGSRGCPICCKWFLCLWVCRAAGPSLFSRSVAINRCPSPGWSFQHIHLASYQRAGSMETTSSSSWHPNPIWCCKVYFLHFSSLKHHHLTHAGIHLQVPSFT